MRSTSPVPFRCCALFLALALAGCATAPGAPCDPPAREQVQDLLYFGTRTPTGEVTPAEWAEFLADTVTPRFPAGLTVWPPQGQWRDVDGTPVREDSYVLNLVHPADAANERAIAEIVAAYRERFRQQSVLRVRSLACVSG